MKVLFSTDGSKQSFEIEGCLTSIGNRDCVSVTVLTVGDRLGRVFPTTGGSSQRAGWEAWDVADAGRSRVEQEGFSATSLATLGSPHEEIALQARRGRFDLTLIGGASQPHPQRSMFPATAALVLARSRSALFLSRSRPRDHVQVLLVADGSDGSRAALKCFREFADPRLCTTTSVTLAESPIEQVRSGYFGVVVCGVSLNRGEIAAEPVVEEFVRVAPSVMVARG